MSFVLARSFFATLFYFLSQFFILLYRFCLFGFLVFPLISVKMAKIS